jgi:hypothetical protein
MVRFEGPVEYKRPIDTTMPIISRFAGMPVGVQLLSDWIIYHENFITSASLPMDTVNWTITDTGAATRALSDDASPPFLTLTNAAADNDSQELQWTAPDGAGAWLGLATDKDIYFEIMLRFRDAGNIAPAAEQNDWFFGLAITDTAVLDGTTDFVGFSKVDITTDATQAINFVSGVGGGAGGLLRDELLAPTDWTTDLTTSGITAANTAAGRVIRRQNKIVGGNDWCKLAMLLTPSNTGAVCAAYCWINDEFQYGMGTKGRTNIPTANIPTNALCLTLCFQNGEAVAKICDITNIILAKRIRQDDGLLVA